MRNANNNGFVKLVIESDPSQARRIQDDVERALKEHQYEEKEIFGIKLALEEALVNAIKHGNELDKSKNVTVRYQVSKDRFEVTIQDEGPGFDPEDLPDPMAPENLERDCGRGLLLMKHYMTDVVFHSSGNVVSMVKERQPNDAEDTD